MSFFPFFFFSPLNPILLFFYFTRTRTILRTHHRKKSWNISRSIYHLSCTHNFNGGTHTHAYTSDLYFILLPRSSFFFLFIYLGTVLFENVYNEAFFFSSSFFGKRGKGKFNEKQKKKRKKSNGRIGNEIGTLVSM